MIKPIASSSRQARVIATPLLTIIGVSRIHMSAVRRLPKETPSKDHLFQPIDDSLFPRGYLATGLYCGVKKHKILDKPPPNDLAVIVSTSPRTSSAACFTLNAFKAAPVTVSTEVLASSGGRARALVINSGCANAVTGKQGNQDAWDMVRTTDAVVATHSDTASSQDAAGSQTLVMSTGVIGQNLPINKILAGIEKASGMLAADGGGFEGWTKAAKSFMTTDTFPKLRARKFEINGKEVRIAGIDKGAGMIHPTMGPPPAPHATLLGVIATDAAVAPASLQTALTYAVNRSFNSISVDGDMSTNDSIMVFANGASGMENEIDEQKDPEAYQVFRDELTAFAVELAKLVVYDGEGATKFVTVSVNGAHTYEDAHKIASSVSTSMLVKCALYGEDANWGRVLCAVGYTKHLTQPIDLADVTVSFVPGDGSAPLNLLVNGEPEKVDEARAKQILEQSELEIKIDLGSKGKESAQYYTCDLSHEYVTINGDYRS